MCVYGLGKIHVPIYKLMNSLYFGLSIRWGIYPTAIGAASVFIACEAILFLNQTNRRTQSAEYLFGTSLIILIRYISTCQLLLVRSADSYALSIWKLVAQTHSCTLLYAHTHTISSLRLARYLLDYETQYLESDKPIAGYPTPASILHVVTALHCYYAICESYL